MAIARRSVGTAAKSAGATSVTPGMPAGWQPGDLLVAFVRNSSPVTFPAGWTKEIDHTTGAPFTIGYRRAQAGDTAPLVSQPGGGAIHAVVVAYTGALASGNPIDHPTAAKNNASSTTVTSNNFTPSVAGEIVIFFVSIANNRSVSGYSGTNPTFSEMLDTNSPDVSMAAADGLKTDTTATGARTATLDSASPNTGALFGIKPEGGSPIRMLV